MQNVKSAVRTFLLDNFAMGGDVSIGDDTSFTEEHILDSTGFIELITFIEENFDVKVSDEEMLPQNFDTLNNIESYLAHKRERPAAAA